MKHYTNIEEVSEFGDLIEINEWLECVKYGAFIDYDGYGNLVNTDNKTYSDEDFYPSDSEGANLSDWTHIMWYNR